MDLTIDAYAYRVSVASRRVCFTLFVPDPVRHVLTRCFRFNFLLRKRSPSLYFLDRSLHESALKSLLGLINILNSHNSYLSTSPARRVYISSLKPSEMNQLRRSYSLDLHVYHRPPPIRVRARPRAYQVQCPSLCSSVYLLYASTGLFST